MALNEGETCIQNYGTLIETSIGTVMNDFVNFTNAGNQIVSTTEILISTILDTTSLINVNAVNNQDTCQANPYYNIEANLSDTITAEVNT